MSDNPNHPDQYPPEPSAAGVADRSLVDDATAAFEAGIEFLDELQQRFLHQLTGPDLLARFYGRGGGAPRGRERPGDLTITGVSAATKDRFTVGAGARAMETGRYLDALTRLHEEMRRLADTGDHPDVAAVLERLGLQTVTA